MFKLERLLRLILSILLIGVFMLSISSSSATDILNDTFLEGTDLDVVSEISESDIIAFEKTVEENAISQSVPNDTVCATESANETKLGESETIYGSDYQQITTLTIDGVKDYYYYGDIVKFNVYHSRYYNGEPCSTYVCVLIDNDYPNSYSAVLQTGEYLTLYAGDFKLGSHILSARYSDHTTNLEEVTFYVLKNPVKFSNPTKAVRKYAKVKTLKITAKLANGKPLSKKYVYLKINGKTYKAKTSSKGLATFKFLLPKKTKTYSYKVKYYGEYGYNAKTYSGKLRVR